MVKELVLYLILNYRRIYYAWRNKGLHVDIKDKDNEVLFSVDVSEHSLRYAEDCAENYASGIVDYAK